RIGIERSVAVLELLQGLQVLEVPDRPDQPAELTKRFALARAESLVLAQQLRQVALAQWDIVLAVRVLGHDRILKELTREPPATGPTITQTPCVIVHQAGPRSAPSVYRLPDAGLRESSSNVLFALRLRNAVDPTRPVAVAAERLDRSRQRHGAEAL